MRIRNACRPGLTALLQIAGTMVAWPVLAQDRATKLATGSDIVSMPSAGRVLLGFAITVAVALAAAYALRRFLPRLTRRFSAPSTLDLVVSSTVRNGVRFHLVKIGDREVLVVEAKSGIGMTVLPDKSNNSATPT